MTGAALPERWAIDISLVLDATLGRDRFPVDVALVAKEYSAQRYPDDPVSLVVGRSLPRLDGALYRAPTGKKGWGIFYNSAIASEGLALRSLILRTLRQINALSIWALDSVPKVSQFAH